MITMKDIARHLGISRTTVSVCLSGKAGQYKISEETSKNVLEYAAKAGFVPDQTAISLARGKKATIGIFVNLFSSGKSNEALRYLLEAIVDKDINYRVMHFQRDSVLSCIREMLGHGTRTIIIIGWFDNDAFLESMEPYLRNGVKLFLVDYCFTAPLKKKWKNAYFIGINREKAYLKTFEYLYKMGHRKIAFTSNVPRLKAWKKFSEKYSLPFNYALRPPLPDFCMQSSDEPFMDELIQLYKREKITAVMLSSDFLAAKLIERLQKEGIRVPEDISVAGFDNLASSPYYNVPLTTIDVPMDKLINKVLDVILRRKELPQEVIIESELIIRSSVAKIPAEVKTIT
ncbi:MAG: LacI family DNA-binding transcriptional regulator [Victivallaceae bacterium]|nr:LacI family DNA-binding transcriptional regulator [Victivallaceae bacterium]